LCSNSKLSRVECPCRICRKITGNGSPVVLRFLFLETQTLEVSDLHVLHLNEGFLVMLPVLEFFLYPDTEIKKIFGTFLQKKTWPVQTSERLTLLVIESSCRKLKRTSFQTTKLRKKSEKN
jgi:hypothetical protein